MHYETLFRSFDLIIFGIGGGRFGDAALKQHFD